MKTFIILLCVLFLLGCSHNQQYALVTKDGILYSNLKNLNDCKRILYEFDIKGICIVQ